MTVVIDANALVALLASEPHGPTVAKLVEQWVAEERELHAPALARYEIANVLTRQLATGQLSKEDVESGWQALEELPITYHTLIDGPAVIDVAATLGRRSAFDAAFSTHSTKPDRLVTQQRARVEAWLSRQTLAA